MTITARTPTVAEVNPGTTVTGTIPPTAVTGDYVIAQFGMTCTVAQFTRPSAGDGWVEIVAPTANNNNADIVAVYGMFNPTVAPAGTSSAATAKQTCIMQAWGGVDPTTPVDVAAATSNGILPLAITGVTTVTVGARLLAGVAADFSTGTWTIPGTMTLVANHTSGTGRGTVIAEEDRPTPGATGTRTFTATTLQAAAGYVLALRPASTTAEDVGLPTIGWWPGDGPFQADRFLADPTSADDTQAATAVNVDDVTAPDIGHTTADPAVQVAANDQAAPGTSHTTQDTVFGLGVPAGDNATTHTTGDASITLQVTAGQATNTHTTGDAAPALAVPAGDAATTHQTFDATVSTAVILNVNAGPTTHDVTTGDPTPAMSLPAEGTTHTQTAPDALPGVGSPAGQAATSHDAGTPTAALAAAAGTPTTSHTTADPAPALAVTDPAAPTITHQTFDATVSTTVITNVNAQAATNDHTTPGVTPLAALPAEAPSIAHSAFNATVTTAAAPVAYISVDAGSTTAGAAEGATAGGGLDNGAAVTGLIG